MAQALSQRSTSETHVLKMLSQGAPMVEVLNELCNFIDAKSPGVIPTVLLPDGDGHLRLAAGPKAPQIWNEAFHGMRVSSYASFHSMPGHQGKPIPVADMTSDPSFAAGWDLALSQGVQAAWSVPILSKDGKILGTLILFYPTPQPPGERDLELVEQVIHMAAMRSNVTGTKKSYGSFQGGFISLKMRSAVGLLANCTTARGRILPSWK